MVVVGAAVLVPQLAIYYQATGRILVSSYGNLGFTFLSPHLWGVLFSVQKGLFFWSPLLLAAIAGFVVGARRKLPFLAATAVVLAVDTYLIASWWDWQFGASYGHRGFVDTLPLARVRPRGLLRVECAERRQAGSRCRAGDLRPSHCRCSRCCSIGTAYCQWPT